MNKKILAGGAAVLGIIFVALAIVYWTIPAASLPTFIPGHIAGSAQIHLKHGIASFILALGLFAFAWFKSGE